MRNGSRATDLRDSEMITKRIIKYVLSNGLFTYSIYAGYYIGSEGWQNVAVFIAWALACLFFIAYLGGFTGDKKAASEVGKVLVNDSKIFTTTDVVLDVLVSLAFVYYGAFFTGIVYTLYALTLPTFKDECIKIYSEDKED